MEFYPLGYWLAMTVQASVAVKMESVLAVNFAGSPKRRVQQTSEYLAQ